MNMITEAMPALLNEVIVDYYDGMTLGCAQISDSPQYYLVSLLYFSPEKGERIFQLIAVDDYWMMRVKSSVNYKNYMELVNIFNNKISNHTGVVRLMKTNEYDNVRNIILKTDLSPVVYNNIESALYQNQWLDYFDM